MRSILAPLFEILTGDVAVCDNILINYAIMLVVGEIAFRVARSLVGDAYRFGLIDGKSLGSLLHWVIRLFLYVVIAFILRALIAVYRFAIGLPAWVWLGLLALMTTGILALAVWLIRKFHSNRYNGA